MGGWMLHTGGGGLGGGAIAAVLSWLLQEGTRHFYRGLSGPGRIVDLHIGLVLLLVVGVVAAAHQAPPSRFGDSSHMAGDRLSPTVVGGMIPNWYPDWMSGFVLRTLGGLPVVIVGMLTVAPVRSVIRRQSSQFTPRQAEAETSVGSAYAEHNVPRGDAPIDALEAGGVVGVDLRRFERVFPPACLPVCCS